MELAVCFICKRETSDPLLWPPDAESKIVTCEECFIELVLLSKELSSRAPTLSPPEVTLSKVSKAPIEEDEPSFVKPDIKHRRLTSRWAFERSAKMSWLVDDGSVSTTVQLVDGSEQGLGIRSPKVVDAGRAVGIRLADATALRGDVRHCSPVEGGFRLGVRLKNVRLLPSF